MGMNTIMLGRRSSWDDEERKDLGLGPKGQGR